MKAIIYLSISLSLLFASCNDSSQRKHDPKNGEAKESAYQNNSLANDKEDSSSAKSDKKDRSGMYHYWIGGEEAPTGQVYYDIEFKDDTHFEFTARGDEMSGTIDVKGTGIMVSHNKATGRGMKVFTTESEEDNESCQSECSFSFEFGIDFLNAEPTDCKAKIMSSDESCWEGATHIYGNNLKKLSSEERTRILN